MERARGCVCWASIRNVSCQDSFLRSSCFSPVLYCCCIVSTSALGAAVRGFLKSLRKGVTKKSNVCSGLNGGALSLSNCVPVSAIHECAVSVVLKKKSAVRVSHLLNRLPSLPYTCLQTSISVPNVSYFIFTRHVREISTAQREVDSRAELISSHCLRAPTSYCRNTCYRAVLWSISEMDKHNAFEYNKKTRQPLTDFIIETPAPAPFF